MTGKDDTVQFFLGANTPQGFVSRFDEILYPTQDIYTFIVKGGPGTGKSTLMEKMYESLKDRCKEIERIHCCSDVDSLDAVVYHDIRTAILDGTAPHAVDAKYPGIHTKVVDLGQYWDERVLKSQEAQIVSLTQQGSKCHQQSDRFLAAAAALMGDTYRIAMEKTDQQKIIRYAGRFAMRELKPTGQIAPCERVRFLSGVTNKGLVTFDKTVEKLCDRVYMIEDEYGAASRILLSTLRQKALESGYDIITCYCPFSPFEKIDHLLIPQLKLGIVTVNRMLQMEMEPYRTIHAKRFCDEDYIKNRKNRIHFNRKAAAEMIDRGVGLLEEAKEIHDQLEKCYQKAMDYTAVERVQEEIVSAVLKKLG